MVAISWFGYDSYKSLGKGQMGGELALPMWIDFMKVALKDPMGKIEGVDITFKSETLDPAALIAHMRRMFEGHDLIVMPG